MARYLLAIILFTFCSTNVIAKEKLNGNLTVVAVKNTESIKIDGVLDEDFWNQAPIYSNFKQNFPSDTAFSSIQTNVRIGFNDKFLYIAAECFENVSNPIVQSLRRDFDFRQSDAFAVYLDPSNDQTNGYAFWISPYGTQAEGNITWGGMMGVSQGWDQAWFSETKRYNDKWVVEIAIPFQSIRYSELTDVWGINFARNSMSLFERSTFAPVPRNFDVGSLIYAANLRFQQNLPKPKLKANILPYVITSTNQIAGQNTEIKPNLGADAKIPLGSLNLDITINPDFAQVDVDRQVTNLTRFSLFFPERRTFFQENSDLFSNVGFSRIRPFFSRRVGLNYGKPTQIAAGARLSGKLNDKTRLGLMTMQTPRQSLNLGEDTALLAPENFSIVALQYVVFKTSNISFIGVNRQGTDKENRSNFNRVAGFDFNFVSPNSFWRGKAFFHKSFSPNNPEQSYAHATWFSFSKPNFRFNLNYEYVNKNYNAASGFVPRIYNYNAKTGETILLTYWRQEHDVSYRWYPESKKFNNYGIGINWDSYHLSDYTTTDRSANVFVFANMANNASATLTYGNSYINLIFPTNISGRNEDLLEPGKFFNQSISLSYQSNRSAKFYFGTDGSYGTFYDYYLANANVNINWRMSFWGILALNSTYNNLRKQNNTYTTDLYLIGPRVDITFSRNFYFTVLSQYNTQLQNSNFNARLQWRFKPMSDFFIVYTDNRNTLGYGLKDRSMAAKLVYWF